MACTTKQLVAQVLAGNSGSYLARPGLDGRTATDLGMPGLQYAGPGIVGLEMLADGGWAVVALLECMCCSGAVSSLQVLHQSLVAYTVSAEQLVESLSSISDLVGRTPMHQSHLAGKVADHPADLDLAHTAWHYLALSDPGQQETVRAEDREHEDLELYGLDLEAYDLDLLGWLVCTCTSDPYDLE